MRDPRTDPRQGDRLWGPSGVEVRVDIVTDRAVYYARFRPDSDYALGLNQMPIDRFKEAAKQAVRVELRKLDEEARCPECGEWSPVAWSGAVPPGGMWWADSAGCPKCGATVLVESECEIRKTRVDRGLAHFVHSFERERT